MSDLFERQRQLQIEADDVVELLQLEDLLGAFGRPVRVGSSAMGLMVRRDIDITVICPRLDTATLAAFADVASLLMQKTTHVVSVRFRNDTGAWNSEPAKYPDGLYLGLTVHARNDAIWTLDIWAVDHPERQPDLGHLETLLPRMTHEHRGAILQIKQALAERQEGMATVPSAVVYEAVVNHDVRTVEQLELWWRKRST